MFKKYISFNKLKSLAENPLDLTKSGELNPSRINEMQLSACGWKMLYATERVNHYTLDSLCDIAKEANVFAKFESMHDMKVMNFVKGL